MSTLTRFRATGPVVADLVPWRDWCGRERHTLVAKCTLVLERDGLARLSSGRDQLPLLRRDCVPWKQHGDVLLRGTAHGDGSLHALVRLAIARGADVVHIVEGLFEVGADVRWDEDRPAPSAPPEVTGETPLSCFQCAPQDRRVHELTGGEQLLLAHLFADSESARFRLPALGMHAALRDMTLPMRLDTLFVDSDRLIASLTWRGVVPADVQLRDDEIRLALLPLLAVEEVEGEPRAWSRGLSGVETGARERVPILDETPYRVASFTWCRPTRSWAHTIAIKGTFDVASDGSLRVAGALSPLTGDVVATGDPASGVYGLERATDIVPFKPQCEVVVVGMAHAPDGENLALVTLEIGDVRKSIVAMGRRSWGRDGVPTLPTAFEPVPLHHGFAFGGEGFADNPVGMGVGATEPPRLENPDALVSQRGDRRQPACFSPIPEIWDARRKLLGPLDAEELEAAWPALPRHIDMTFFNAAPPDQRCASWRGDERFRVTCVRPGGGGIEGTLPGMHPQIFVRKRQADGAAAVESIVPRLDTIVVDADAGQLTLTWRAVVDVADEDASDLLELAVIDAPLHEQADTKRAWALMVSRRDARFQPTGGRRAPNTAPPWTTLVASVSPAPPPPIPEAHPPTRSAIEGWLNADDLAGRDLSGADLSQLDFSGRDLSGCIFSGANIDGCRFDGAVLKDASLASACGSDTSWCGADARRVDATGCKLDRADFSDAVLTSATFADAELSEVVFRRVMGERAVWTGAHLGAVSFAEARLERADLSRAVVQDADLRGASLERAKCLGLTASDWNAHGIVLHRAQLSGAVLTRCRFSGAVAEASNWDDVDSSEAAFDQASLENASFVRARLDGADFSGAKLVGARLERASLGKAKLAGANLMFAVLERANLRDADATGAGLYMADLRGADLRGARCDDAHLAGTLLAKDKRS